MSPVNYLDRAVSALRTLGINLQTEQGAPVVTILEKIDRYDNAKVAAIAATLQQSSSFNAAVREQIAGMDISTRYADIAERFNSIRDDAQQMVGWMADGKLDFRERLQQNWMRLRRGSIPDRFNDIRTTYLIEELRKESTQAAQEIEDATEDSKRRFVGLVNKGA